MDGSSLELVARTWSLGRLVQRSPWLVVASLAWSSLVVARKSLEGLVTRLGPLPSSVLTLPLSFYFFYERKIILITFDTGITIHSHQIKYILGSIFFNIASCNYA